MTEQRGTTLSPLADLGDLRRLVRADAPFLSVYMAFAPAHENLAEELSRRWRSERQCAAKAGAPERVLALVDEGLAGGPRQGEGLCALVPDAGGAHVEHLGVAPPVEHVAWEPVPLLRPLIALRQRRPPHVVALVDRVGADILVREGDEDLRTSIEGADDPINKVRGGGWSHRRMQQRAEETWHRNMDEVADELARQVDEHGARLVAVGGDLRAVGLLTDALPPSVRELVRPIDPTRAEDGSLARLDEEIAAVLDDWTAAQLEETAGLHAEEQGQDDRATAGEETTLAALRAARVATLLVPVGWDERCAWMGTDPEQIASGTGDLADPGMARPVPLLDGAVAAALASGADVRIVPEDAAPPERLGALLRW